MNNRTKGLEFEKHCMNLLLQLGFTSAEQVGRSGDQGADILGTYENTRYVFQCKDHGKKQGNWSVQEVIGSKSIYKASRAGVISRAGFTTKAIDLARANYVLPLTNADLEASIARKESFSAVISSYTFPPALQLEHDYDVVKKYEEVKKRIGHVPQRHDFDATALYHINKKYGGLLKLIASLSDRPYTKRPDDTRIKDEYKRVRQLIGHVPTLEDMRKHSEFSGNCFHEYPFTRLQRECGDRPYKEIGLDKTALREAYTALQTELGRPPSRKELDQKGKYRSASYTRLWGTWEAFTKEMGIPYFKGTRPKFTKEEFLVTYLLVNKLLEIRQQGISPDSWTIRHELSFKGKRVIDQHRICDLFGKAESFRQALFSENAQNLKRAMDDLIRACLTESEEL